MPPSKIRTRQILYTRVSTGVSYSALLTDDYIEHSVAGTTTTLPTSVGNATKEYVLTNVSSGNVTIATTSSQYIGNLPSGNPTSYTLPNNMTLILYSDGTGWRIKALTPAPGVGGTYASTQSQPTNPTGTTSLTGVMAGLAVAFTPSNTGKVLILISANCRNSTSSAGSSMQIRYGTGAAPANGTALTGTTAGNISSGINGGTQLPTFPLNCNARVTGLLVGTSYWIDVSQSATTGGTATLTSFSVSIIELP